MLTFGSSMLSQYHTPRYQSTHYMMTYCLPCISLTSACNVLFWPATQEWEIFKLDMECNEKQTEILNIAAMNFYVMMMTQNYFWIVF